MITLTLRDNGGTALGGENETSITFTVIVEEAIQQVFIPNLFTPNASGTNDAFRIRGTGIEQIQFRVFDVSGEELFSTIDVREAWMLQGQYNDGRAITDSGLGMGGWFW